MLFWAGFGLLLYHLAGYPLLEWFLTRGGKTGQDTAEKTTEALPTVTVLCPSYNEELHIKEKIESFLALDYPPDKIKMLVISDDSTDKTNSIVQKYTDRNIELVIQHPRGGKQRAHNRAEPGIGTDLVLSTDANSIFAPDAVLLLVKALQSEPKAGMAVGELKLVRAGCSESGEGLYWKYEAWLKKLDSALHSVICANGSLFLIRRDLFGQVRPNTADDFERTLLVLASGKKAVYVPRATVREDVSEQAIEELGRKARIIRGEWIALAKYARLLNPFRFGKTAFILFSHKLVRWLFWLFLLMMLIGSAFAGSEFYTWLFWLQILFYAVGAAGLILQKQGKRLPGTGLISYVTAMGWASLLAFLQFVFFNDHDSGIWNTARNQSTR